MDNESPRLDQVDEVPFWEQRTLSSVIDTSPPLSAGCFSPAPSLLRNTFTPSPIFTSLHSEPIDGEENHTVLTVQRTLPRPTAPCPPPFRLTSPFDISVCSADIDIIYRPVDFPFRVIGQCIRCGRHRPPCNKCSSTHCPHSERTCFGCLDQVVYRLERLHELSRPPPLPTKFQSGVAEIVQAFIPDWDHCLRHPVADRILHRCPLLVVLGFAHFIQSYQPLWMILWKHLAQQEENRLRQMFGISAVLLRSIWSLLAALAGQVQQLMISQHGHLLSRIVTARTRWGPPSLFSPSDWRRVMELLDRTGASFERFAEALEDQLNEIYPMHRLMSGAMAQTRREAILHLADPDGQTDTETELQLLLSHRSEEIARILRYLVVDRMARTVTSICHRILEHEGVERQSHSVSQSPMCSPMSQCSSASKELSQTMKGVKALVCLVKQLQLQMHTLNPVLGPIGIKDVENLLEYQSSYHVGSPFRFEGPPGCECECGMDPPDVLAQLLSYDELNRSPLLPQPDASVQTSVESHHHGCFVKRTGSGDAHGMLRYHNLPQRSPEQTVVIGTRVDNHQFMSQRSSGLSTVSGHELLSSTSSHQSTFPNAETPAPGRQHSVIRPVTVLRLQCMLYTFVLGCLRFLPSVSSQLHTQRGSHALCVQCQALYCGPRAKAGSPSFFRPIEIDPERLVLVRILINSPDSASTTIPHMNRKKRRLNNPTINHPLLRFDPYTYTESVFYRSVVRSVVRSVLVRIKPQQA